MTSPSTSTAKKLRANQRRFLGGPWDGQVLTIRWGVRRTSLVFSIGEFRGRYDLTTGVWLPL
jgi:hypothetical protein